MRKFRVISKDALLMAAKTGAKKGYEKSVTNMIVFKNALEASGKEAFAVPFFKHVDSHTRVTIQLGGQVGAILLDIDRAMFDLLPLYDREAGTSKSGGVTQ
jgi:hypothetical protein